MEWEGASSAELFLRFFPEPLLLLTLPVLLQVPLPAEDSLGLKDLLDFIFWGLLGIGEGTEESTVGVEGDEDTCLDCILQTGSTAPKVAGLAFSVVPCDGTDLLFRDTQEGDTNAGDDITVVGKRKPAALTPNCEAGVEFVRCGARIDAVLLDAGGIFLQVNRKTNKNLRTYHSSE